MNFYNLKTKLIIKILNLGRMGLVISKEEIFKELINASIHGHLESVKKLLAAGADVHAGDDKALQDASASGHLEVVKELLAAGPRQARLYARPHPPHPNQIQ